MSSPVAKRLDTEAQPLILGLADDLLEDILLRVPTLADVGRVATGCRTFRRVIADRSFRRRLRSVHRAPFLGFFLRDKFHPAEAPHPSAPYGRALMRAADLSFSFVSSDLRDFRVRDFRDGRALLDLMNGDYVVADPVSRRYALLPRVPILTKMTKFLQHLEHPFLVWQPFPYEDWSTQAGSILNMTGTKFRWHYCFGSCVYWVLYCMNKLLVLDTCTMEFSFTEVPPACYIGPGNEAICNWGDCSGSAEMFILRRDAGCESQSLYSSTRQGNVIGGANASASMKKLPVQLPSRCIFFIAGADEMRYLLLLGVSRDVKWHPHKKWKMEYFLLQLDTMQLDKVCVLDPGAQYTNVYVGFPPSLSLPSL